MAEEKTRNTDIWLILVIILIVLSIGGGLWLTGKSVLARLDALSVATRNQNSVLETELFELRKQVQGAEFILRKMAKKDGIDLQPAARPTAAPKAGDAKAGDAKAADAKAADPKAGDAKAAEPKKEPAPKKAAEPKAK
jgi:hypothetical protein